ncbi:MAG: adenosylcobinamide-phosphate synthase CbiB, partial [Actinomycetota bacterium]
GCPVRRAAFTAAVTWAALGGRSLERNAARVGALVAAADMDGARARLPTLVGRDPTRLEASEVCRAAIESVAENTVDAVIGPVFWGAVAGPAGVAAYRAVNTLDAMVGHRGLRYEHFGWAAARLDDLLTWSAARLSAAVAVALAPSVAGDRAAAWRTLRRDGARHPSPNAGRLEAAFAGALGVRLGGRNRYPSGVERRPDLGAGRLPEPEDVLRATRLARWTGLVAAALVIGAAAMRSRR